MEKRVYFNPHLLRDELLSSLVTEEQIIQSTRYIEDLALSLGVSPNKIAKPVPYKVEILASYYTLMITALQQSMMNSDGSENGEDAYELKRKVYAKMVYDLEGQITRGMLLGYTSTRRRAFPEVLPLSRG